jgi:crossover junction endodeoxyribonuclease RusA
MLTLSLSVPPSYNHFFCYYQGRPVLSKEARAYRHQVRRIVGAKGIKPLMGPLAVRVDYFPPDNRRRDIDNCLKSVLDALQHAGVFWDDSQVVWLLTIKHPSRADGSVQVRIDDVSEQSLTTWLETFQSCPQS